MATKVILHIGHVASKAARSQAAPLIILGSGIGSALRALATLVVVPAATAEPDACFKAIVLIGVVVLELNLMLIVQLSSRRSFEFDLPSMN